MTNPLNKFKMPKLPVMINPIVFYAMAIGLLYIMMHFQSKGQEPGEAEWTIVNIIVGGIITAAGMVVQAYTNGQKSKEE